MVTTQIEQGTKTAPKPVKARNQFVSCMDCGNERIVATQDAFQVKRCVPCQLKHRKAMRKLNRTTKIERLQARIKELESR